MKVVVITVCAVLCFVPAAGADESGPKAGEKLPELKAFGVVGSVEGKEVDFVKERKGAPTIYLFVQAEASGIPVGGRPLARFMRALDEKLGDASDKAAIVAIWLGEKAFDRHKEYLPKINMSLKFEKTSLAAFDGNKSGPNNWAVNSDSHITVVIANKGKVVKSFGFTSVNETDVRTVLKELKDAAN